MPANRSLRTALLENRRRQREDGYQFEFTASNLGIPEDDQIKPGRYRRLNTTDPATIELLPSHLQATVWDGIKEFEKIQKANKAGGNDPQSLLEAVRNNQKSMKAANAFCVAAFITPVIVATEDEYERSPDAEYVVTDIAEEDRINLFIICMDADQAQARNLKLFRPERAAHAQVGAVGAVAATPIGDHELAATGA